jgi:hypothetical protein
MTTSDSNPEITIRDRFGQILYAGPKSGLREKNLSEAELAGVDLSRVDLSGANLTYAGLAEANLRGAILTYANLTCTDLSRADLSRANLYHANLRGAPLTGANLTGAILSGADLHGANLTDATLPPLSILPAGTLTGWKKAFGTTDTGRYHEVLVKLQIPASAQRVNSTGRKCRAAKAKVLRLETRDGHRFEGEVHSSWDESFRYRVGETVTPQRDFNPDFRVECSSGIHFFITRQEAEDYII